jgi:hypothetical protein
MELVKWFVWYISCEGNKRWYTIEVPADWQEWQVEESIPIGGCGDDVAELLSVERAEGRIYPV